MYPFTVFGLLQILVQVDLGYDFVGKSVFLLISLFLQDNITLENLLFKGIFPSVLLISLEYLSLFL